MLCLLPLAMVLLQLTPSLQDRLSTLLPLLPLELQQEVASHLVDEEGMSNDGESAVESKLAGVRTLELKQRGGGRRTVSHDLLVKVSRWARGKEDLADAGTLLLASNVLPVVLTTLYS